MVFLIERKLSSNNHGPLFNQSKIENFLPHGLLPWTSEQKLNDIDQNEIPCKSQIFIAHQASLAEIRVESRHFI